MKSTADNASWTPTGIRIYLVKNRSGECDEANKLERPHIFLKEKV